MSEGRYGEEGYNAANAIAKAIQTDVFKERLFDPDEISLGDMSAALIESGFGDDLDRHNIEFHLGYRYMLWIGIPDPQYFDSGLTDRLGQLERTVEELRD
jgi:hypothetical protein